MTNTTALPEATLDRPSESPITDNAAEAAHKAVSGMAEKTASAERTIRTQAEKTQAQAKMKAEDAKETVQKTVSDVEAYARENPLAAAGIAFGAGILASMLLRR